MFSYWNGFDTGRREVLAVLESYKTAYVTRAKATNFDGHRALFVGKSAAFDEALRELRRVE